MEPASDTVSTTSYRSSYVVELIITAPDHFGVLRAFVNAHLLPRVITGTSAGGLVAALAGTRTDVELKRLLVPELADRITACEEPFNKWMKRFWKTGARFDSVDWARKVLPIKDSACRDAHHKPIGLLLYKGIVNVP